MPYVKPDTRKILDACGRHAHTTGDLNYQLTMIVKTYLETHGLSYKTINDIVGALEGAKLEFYRRVAAPYENEKIEQNGDIYK